MINNFFKKAFTLLEVLTVLAIVGTIAGLTMPTLMNNIAAQKNMTMLKKLYSSYTINIESLLNSEYATSCNSLACLRKWKELDDYTGKHNGALADTRYFNVAGECIGDCLTDFFDSGSRFPIGQMGYNVNSKELKGSLYLLPNSAAVLIYDGNSNCNENPSGNDFKYCSVIVFDTNGSKGPNTPCMDRFAFYVANRPYGNDANHIPPNYLVPFGYANLNGNGDFDCTARIISNGWNK